MSAKKNTTTTASSDSMPAVKIGSRVRCTDGVLGKITWANGVSVKIKWDDGEQVTWKRAELPGKPIEILAADDEPRNEQPAPETETPTAEAAPAAEQVAATEPTEPGAVAAITTSEQVSAAESQTMDAAATAIPEQTADTPATEPVLVVAEPTESTPLALGIYIPETTAPAKPKRERKAKTPTEPKVKKMSALDAAARVLTESGTAMTCKEMVGVMAAKGYWSSPGGKTPDATLCAAILTEIKKKGEQSRFVKAAPGRFAIRPTA